MFPARPPHHHGGGGGGEAPADVPPVSERPGVAGARGEGKTQQGRVEDEEGQTGEHGFTCHVCLECPRQPVATVCGHIYCWGCLYKWLNMHRDDPACPVCKAGIEMPNDDPTNAKVIPLYVSGRCEADPRTTIHESPPRPPTDRPPPQRFPNFQGGMPGFGAFNGHVSVSAGLGLLPSLIGLTFVPAQFTNNGVPMGGPGGPPGAGEAGAQPNGTVGSQDEVAQQEFLSRMLFLIGTFIALCLIFFP